MSTREERLKKLQEAYSRRENISSGTSVSADPERERRLQVLQNHYNNVYLPKQVNAWAQEMNEFSKKISADAQARSKGYQSPDALKAYQDSISGQLNDLISRSKYAQQYASLNPNDINFNTGIKDTLDYLNNITKGLQDEQSYWSQWANEDAYKNSANYFANEFGEEAKKYNGGTLFSTGLDTAGQNIAGNGRDIYEAIMGHKYGSFPDKLFTLGATGWSFGNQQERAKAINKDEANMYWYLLDNVSKEEADRYYQTILPRLADRAGAKASEKMMESAGDNQFWKDALATLYSIPAGYSSAITGIGNAILLPFGETVAPTALEKAHQYNKQNLSDVGGVFADLGYTTGNMLPSIATSYISGSPLLGAGITAMSSGGNAYAEALEQGYTREQATAYGLINGALEGGLQYVLGGIGKLGGKGWDLLSKTKAGSAISGKLSSFVTNIKSGIGRAALQMGGEFLKSAGQEGFEEGLQAIIDPLLRSAILEENLDIDWDEVAYSAMLGAMSAGLWEGGSIVSNSAQANAIGKKAFESGSWQGALDYALALDPNSTPYKLAKGLQDGSIKADGNNVGNLYSALVEYMQESKTLVRKGKMTTDQYVSGQSALQQIYEARSKAEAKNNASADISPNIMSARLYQEIKGLGLDEKTATKYSNAITNLKEGTEVSNKITNELISGNSPVKDIVARELGIDTTNKTAAELRNAVKSYVDTVKSQPKTEAAEQTAPKTEKELQYEQAKAATAQLSKVLGEKGQAVYNEFSEGMRTGDSLMYFNNAVFDFYNQGVEASLKKNPPKKYTDIARYEGIAPIIKQKAFEAGKLDNATKAEAVKKTEEKVKSDIKEIKARQKELKHVEFDIKDLAPSAGKWTVDEGVDVDNLKGKQNAAFNYLKAVSEVSGINVHIMSGVNKNGELTTENGFYDSNTNTVYVSINAGAQSLTDITNNAVLKTASHEITHYIAATDTDAYQELRDYVVETFKKEHGEDGLARRISQLQDIYLDQINKELTYEKAIEEMVANACETMIRDSKVFSQLVRQNMTVAERLKDGLDRFVTQMDKNRKAALEGIEETSLEARLLASNADTLKKAQKLWDNALKAAIKKNQTVPDSKVTNATTEVQNPNVMQNLRTMTEDYWAYRNDVVLKGLMTSQEYYKLFTTINVLMGMARKNPDILDFGADINSNNRPFSTIKKNSDSLYQVSLDFSTLCRKRLLQQAIMKRLQTKLQRALTAEEQIKIRNELVKLRKEGKKIEVACALCYVEAARLKAPKTINAIINDPRAMMINYLAQYSPSFDKQMNAKTAKFMVENGFPADTTLAELKRENNSLKNKLDKLRKQWRQEYKPTIVENAAIKAAMELKTNSDAMLSPEGLAELKLAHPLVYQAVMERVAGATRGKALESDMPFKRGDTYGFIDSSGNETLKITDSLIATMNAENGLRYQSWSDFQAMHILDNIAAVMELATRGAKMQTYTKVPDFVTLNGKTGMMINMSLLAQDNGFDADGNLIFDPYEGMPYEEMQKLRDMFPETAGNIVVAVNGDHLTALLASNDIDYVIPYHISGLSKPNREKMGIPEWIDYTKWQSEKYNDKENVNGVKMWHKSPKFSEWFDAEAAAKADDGYAFMREAAQKYLALCEERGLVPKFDEFKTEENYWKLLIDRKMVNHKTGKVIIQQAVKPIFDENAIAVAQNAIADVQAIKDFREVQDSLVEQITSGKVKISDKMTAELVAMQNAPFTSEMESESNGRMMNLRYDDGDQEYLEAIKRGDTETAQAILEQAAKRAGYSSPLLYHGTNHFGFTVPNTSVNHGDGISFWASNKAETSATYTTVSKPREISEVYDDSMVDETIKDIDESIDAQIDEFCGKISKYFSEWVFGYGGGYDVIRNIVERYYNVSDDKLFDGGLYEDLDEIIANAYYDYGEEYQNSYEEYAEWQESEDAEDIYESVSALEGLISKRNNVESTIETSGIYKLYGNTDNFFVIDANGANWNGIRSNTLPSLTKYGIENAAYNTRDVVKWAYDNGYSGVTFKNIVDNGGQGMAGVNDVYAFFEPSKQVKSADLVTYDDNGDIIPPSQRFNPTNPDIRYSLRYDETEFNARRELSSALLTVAQTDAERKSLENYQKKVKVLNEREKIIADRKNKLARLDQVKDAKRYAELQNEIRQQENLLNRDDTELIKLEATKPLKDILTRKEARLKEQLKDTRARQLKAKFRNNIRRNIMSLDKKLRANNGQKHVLQELQPAVAQMLDIFTEDKGVFRKDRLERLHAIYAKFSPDDKSKQANDISADRGYSTDISEYKHTFSKIVSDKIQLLAPLLDGKRLSDLTIEELSAVNDIVSNINQMVNDAETIRVEDKRVELKNVAENSYADMREIDRKSTEIKSAKEFFEYKNALPVYVMERLGDTVMEYLWKPLEQATYKMLREQVADTEFMRSQMRKYDAQSWQGEELTITLESGEKLTAEVEHWMFAYALAKREATHRGLAGENVKHLPVGGIVITTKISEQIDDKILGFIPRHKRYKSKPQGTPLSDADIETINNALTKEQKEYVDAVVKYASTELADRGNKTSQDLHGIDIYGESYYAPYIVSGSHLYQSFIGKGEKLIKNAGMTNALTPNASTPVYIDKFSAVMAQHFLEMERYDSLAVPLDNIDRWLNYQQYEESPSGVRMKVADGRRIKTGVTTRTMLEEVYGTAMESYLNQFLTDVNAASTQASNESIGAALLGKFRKNAVLASLSVAIQQPSAMARVLAYMSPKYIAFRTGWTNYRENYEELLKYSGAAFVKEHGSFDPAVSTSALADMLYLEPEGWQKLTKLFTDSKHRDEILSALPKMMDRITWLRIWQAVKAETADLHPNLKEGSEEFLKVAGERFDYIVNRTQVYDSTLSKSELMRSKATWAKVITSFSAEPTVSYNMLMKGAQEVAMAKGANKGAAWRFFGRTVGAFAYAAMVNALLKSLVTAARKNKPDDEDDKSYIEWYAQEFIGNFLSDLNPLGLLPLVRDFVSLLEGYDLSRTDMEAVKMIADAVDAIADQDMPIEQKLGEIVKAIGIVIGVPVENIMRDAEALINVFVDIFNGWDTSWQGIGDAAQDAIAGLSRFEIAEETGNTADKLYKAMMNGNTNAYKQYYADIVEEFNKKKQEGKTDSKNVESYIRSQMRNRLVDSAEIKAAYEASKASNFAEYDAAVKALTSKGFHPNDVMSAIHSYEERLKKPEDSEPTVEEYEEEDVKLDKGLLVDAIANGKELEAIAEEQSKYKKGSQEYKDNAAKLKRYITQELKPQYQDYFLQGNTAAYNAIAKRLVALRQYGINYDADTLADWRKKAKEDRA